MLLVSEVDLDHSFIRNIVLRFLNVRFHTLYTVKSLILRPTMKFKETHSYEN
jgi:hypothetical protein